MNVLIGGGTGFVGRHLVKCLTSKGARVQVISRMENKSKNQISWVSIFLRLFTKNSRIPIDDFYPHSGGYKKRWTARRD